MIFTSKVLNLRLVLRPSVPNTALQPGKPGLYALFVDGILNVPDTDKERLDLVLNHPMYGRDFVSTVDESPEAAVARQATAHSSEPEHDVIDINYGHVGKNLNPKQSAKLTPELKAALTEMAATLATQMFQEMVKKSQSTVSDDAEKELPVVTEPAEEIIIPEPIVAESEPTTKTSAPQGRKGQTAKVE